MILPRLGYTSLFPRWTKAGHRHAPQPGVGLLTFPKILSVLAIICCLLIFWVREKHGRAQAATSITRALRLYKVGQAVMLLNANGCGLRAAAGVRRASCWPTSVSNLRRVCWASVSYRPESVA